MGNLNPTHSRSTPGAQTLIIETPATYPAERHYILTALLADWLGLPWQRVDAQREDTRIRMAGHNGEILMPDVLFQTAPQTWLTSSSLPSRPLAVWDTAELGLEVNLISRHLPVIYGDHRSPMSSLAPGRICLPLDVFGSAFFMLTRYEEVVIPERDQHDRFPARASLAYQESFLERPLIDEYVQVLRASIEYLWPGAAKPVPEPEMRLTHDVDAPARYALGGFGRMLIHLAADVVKRRAIRSLVSGPRAWIRGPRALDPADPFNCFDWIMDLSEKHGLRSAFYFIAGWTDSQKKPNYDIEMPAIRRLLRRIHDRGHEIGLHPSYNTYQQPDLIAAEAARLKLVCAGEGIQEKAWGGRMHFLRWRTPTTLYGWEQAGMTYDSTLGYSDHAGFRCGTCREYQAFDPVASRSLNLRLRPLIAMETTIIGKKHMGLGVGEAAYEVFLKLKRACRAVNGAFTLLWHNSKLMTTRDKTLYQAVLAA
ncbi:MAG: MarR family transcriptional regulator [Deltaproteobacteria bacterium]|nr:MarR family transcriptional regulator [Deltaproteobacteria bacterium]